MTVTTVPEDGQYPIGSIGSRGSAHFHVHQGEAVSLQLGSEVQMIQGPATVRMVSTSHEPPVPHRQHRVEVVSTLRTVWRERESE